MKLYVWRHGACQPVVPADSLGVGARSKAEAARSVSARPMISSPAGQHIIEENADAFEEKWHEFFAGDR